MAQQSQGKLLWFFVGLLVGLGLGVLGGYILNDLTSRENPEVVEQMREEEQVQQNIDDLLRQTAPPVDDNEVDGTVEEDAP